MRKHVSFWLSVIPLLLLIPYLSTIVFNGVDTALHNRKANVENCLPFILSLQIGYENEPENLKAQAVVARTNLYWQMKKGENLRTIWNETGNTIKNTFQIYSFIKRIEKLEVYESAAQDTQGQVLLYKNELKMIPYHELSNGKTRDGEEALHSREYEYLQSVESGEDKLSPDYLNSFYAAEAQLPGKLEIAERDSAGYVTALSADGNILEGEAFCHGMGLVSADFTIQKIDGKIRFLCKGKGHGLGFSQYGGNRMAQEGNLYEEILTTYFPRMEIGNI